MAKRWVNAGFKSRGEAMEYCAYKGCVSNGKGMVVSCDADGILITRRLHRFVGLKHKFWDSYETLQIEIDEPELEVGKLYQVSNFKDFDDIACKFRIFQSFNGDAFVSEFGESWLYYREVPEKLMGKIK